MDEDFEALLDAYLEPPANPNPVMAGVHIVWVEGDARLGVEHIAAHGVTTEEVEQVIFEFPPYVEAKRHPEVPNKTLFWGATRNDRWLLVVCDDWNEGSTRYLKPITAFEPDEGEDYWRGR